MTIYEKQPQSVIFLGVRADVGTTTLAVNIAAIIGVIARSKTLMLDISGEFGANAYLGISKDRGLLNLISPFLRAGRIPVDELTGQVVRYEPGEPWAVGLSALDVLPGFDHSQLSPAERDRLVAYRGAFLVNAVCESAWQAGYEFVLADGGVWPNGITGMGLGLSQRPGQAVLVSSGREDDVLNMDRPIQMLSQIGWTVTGVFTHTADWRFKWKYGGVSFLEKMDYVTMPSTGKDHLERGKGMPSALLGLRDAKRRPDKITLTLVEVASRLKPNLRETMLDSQGHSLRRVVG